MSNKKGFTLIEMLVVLAIIGIMSSITYPSLARTRDNSRENDRARHEYVVNKALRQHYALTGQYPNQGHDTTKTIIPLAELSALQAGLANQTGVALNETNYTYTYADTNGDGKFEFSSLHVESK